VAVPRNCLFRRFVLTKLAKKKVTIFVSNDREVFYARVTEIYPETKRAGLLKKKKVKWIEWVCSGITDAACLTFINDRVTQEAENSSEYDNRVREGRQIRRDECCFLNVNINTEIP
jgi:hypothetical protein